MVTVCCGWLMDGVGLIWARSMISLPSLIPPMIPPAWLEVLMISPSLTVNPSLSVEPFEEVTAMPSPISTALTAPMDIRAWARRALSLSKTGSPSPAGVPVIRHSITPPALS